MYRRCVLLARDTVKRAIVSLSFEVPRDVARREEKTERERGTYAAAYRNGLRRRRPICKRAAAVPLAAA